MFVSCHILVITVIIHICDGCSGSLFEVVVLHMVYHQIVAADIFKFLPEPRRAIGSESNCRFRGREFDPVLVPYFRGD